MAEYAGPVEAFLALQDFIIDRVAHLPDRLRDRLRECLRERSTVAGVVRAVEAVYARDQLCGDVPPEILEWAAASALMAGANGFHQLDADELAPRLAKVMRRQKLAKARHPKPSDEALRLVGPPAAAEDPAADA